MTALGVGVTIVGLVIGAFVMSPGVTREQRMVALAALGGAAVLILLIALTRRAWRALAKRQSRRASLRGAQRAGTARPAGSAPPTIVLRGGKTKRTPRAVQALAAAGAGPLEIARKTGLPLDAVSMLLELHGAPLATR